MVFPHNVRRRGGEGPDGEKHGHIRGRGLVSSAALGLSDGLVTNLSFLTGFGGVVASIGLIQFAGLSAMLAGAVSMFFGGILAARADSDLYKADARRELYEIEHEPEEEFAELKDIYKEKGLTEEDANYVVSKISARRDKFLEDVLSNELHIHRENLENPFRIGAAVGFSFFVGALVPLIPYLVLSPDKTAAVIVSVVVSLAFLFAAGVWKGTLASRSVWRSGLETLGIGAAATLVLYLIGHLLGFV